MKREERIHKDVNRVQKKLDILEELKPSLTVEEFKEMCDEIKEEIEKLKAKYIGVKVRFD